MKGERFVLVKLRVGRRDVVVFCDLLHGIDPYRALILPARQSCLKFASLVFASRVTKNLLSLKYVRGLIWDDRSAI